MAETIKKKVAARRYYLHKVLKKKYNLDGDNRTIEVPHSSFVEIPIGDRYYIGQLIELGYNVQLKLF